MWEEIQQERWKKELRRKIREIKKKLRKMWEKMQEIEMEWMKKCQRNMK